VFPFRRRLASGCAREQGKDFPEGLLAGNGLWKRLVRHDLVAVAAAILVLADVVHRYEWDEIPHQLTADGSRFVRVDGLTTIPRRTVSVTVADGREPIALLVVPPDTPTETAWAEMNIAATSPGIPQTTDILTAEELQGP